MQNAWGSGSLSVFSCGVPVSRNAAYIRPLLK
jgi:hypothetical protein